MTEWEDSTRPVGRGDGGKPAADKARESEALSAIRHELRTPINHILGYCGILQEEAGVSEQFRADLERIHAGGRRLLELMEEYFEGGGAGAAKSGLDLKRALHQLRTPVTDIIGYCELLEEEAAAGGFEAFLPDLRRIRLAAGLWLESMEAHLVRVARLAGMTGADELKEEPGQGGVDSARESGKPAATEALSFQGSVLVVDDDPAMRELLGRRLCRCGYEVVTAENGSEAMKSLGARKIDLVLLDMVMPEMDGQDVLAMMKADPDLQHIPVIMLSALDQETRIARCIEMGAEDYIGKPFNPVFLRARIGACLDKKRLRDREQETYRALLDSQKRLASELAEAAAYVRSLLPKPLTGEVRARWCFQPSSQLGGDAFGYHWIDEDHFAIYLLDVCGHGVGAALLSVAVMNLLRGQTLPDTNFLDPGAVLSALNRTFPAENQNYMYFTIWYGVYDRRAGVIRYASGGHPPAIALTRDADPGSEWRAVELRTDGPAIGCFEEAGFGSAAFQVGTECTLYVVSDGVYEVAGPDGRSWTFEGLVERLIEARGQGAALEEHLRFVQGVRGSEGLEDDFSMVEVSFGRRRGRNESTRIRS